MINLSFWKTRKNPTPERRKIADDERAKTVERKRYLNSVRYCQRCGREVYPNSQGEYGLVRVFDKKLGVELSVCRECVENDQRKNH